MYSNSNTHYYSFDHRKWRNQADTDSKTSFLLDSIHSTQRNYSCYQRRKVSNQLYTAFNPIIRYNND